VAPDWDRNLSAPLPEAQAERHLLANASEAPRTLHFLHQTLEEQLCSRDGVALVTDERVLSFDELDRLTNALSQELLTTEGALEAPTAVCARKGWEQVVAVLGVLRAGGTYVPVDPDWPTTRQEKTLKAARCSTILCDERGQGVLAGFDGVKLHRVAELDPPAAAHKSQPVGRDHLA